MEQFKTNLDEQHIIEFERAYMEKFYSERGDLGLFRDRLK